MEIEVQNKKQPAGSSFIGHNSGLDVDGHGQGVIYAGSKFGRKNLAMLVSTFEFESTRDRKHVLMP
eukprot:635550-Pelagomonas_calceolata.AAC.1